nr:rRNA-processing endoribonuclease [Polyrhizophydium stewartii]
MCKFHLASAELARFQGDLHEAIAHFEESVERAHTHKMPLLEAWATERQAVFWYGQHSKRLARPIFEAASQQWVALGSQGKATQLQKLYADAFPKALGPGKKLKVGLASFSSFLKIPNQEEREDGAPLAENLRSPRVLDDFVSPMSARVVSQSGVFFGRGRQPDLDVTTILKVAETLSKEENLDVLLDQMLMHLTSNTGATKAYFLLLEDGALSISARYEISDLGQVHRDVGSASGVPSSDVLPMMIINYVCRIPEAVVLADACEDPSYRRDPYVEKNRPRSVLCCPIKHQSRATGLVYLENKLQSGAFTPARVDFVQSLMASASVSIENARLTKRNMELSIALKETASKKDDQPGPKYNFDGPLQRVLDAVESIKAKFSPDDADRSCLDEIVKLLISDSLFAANLNNVNDEHGIAAKFTPIEKFCLCIACAVHDVDHPGYNNNFLVQIQHPLAILYNDVAILESHHASKTFEICASADINIFAALPQDQHFQFINKFKGRIATASLKLEEESDRQLVLEMTVKCGDLGNPTKRFEESKRWSFLVMEEFFRQGDRERMLGLPISKFMDRNDTNIPKCQLGFIDVLVTPLYDSWVQFSATPFTDFCMENIARNREQWQALVDKTDSLPPIAEAKDRMEGILDMAIVPVTFGRRGASSGETSKHVWLMQHRPSMSLNGGRGAGGPRTPVMRRSFGSSGSLPRMVETRSEPTSPAASHLRQPTTPKGVSKSVARKRSMGHNHFRQRLVLATLSGKAVRIENIRSDDEDHPGLADFEASFLRLLEKATNGCTIEINHTGTAVTFKPGTISGGRIRHDCPPSRAIGYFLEPMIALAPFAKKPLELTLTGITNDNVDISVDLVRTLLLPQLARFGIEDGVELKVAKRGAAPLGGGEISFTCPVVRQLKPSQFVDPGHIKRIRGIAYATRMSPQMANRVVEAARSLLTRYIPDVYIYTDVYKGQESGKSPGYALSLVAESTTGALVAAECAYQPRRRAAAPEDEEEPFDQTRAFRNVQRTGRMDGGAAAASQVPAVSDMLVNDYSFPTPEDLGVRVARLLLHEIKRGGTVDTLSQWLSLLFIALGPADVGKVRFGSLSPFTVQYLRDIKAFLDVTFNIMPDPETHSVLLATAGMGFTNINKKVT